MKICIHCGMTYQNDDEFCWSCEELLNDAKECPSCGEWADADFDICEDCHMDWVRKYLRHMKEFRDEITDAQFDNFCDVAEGNDPWELLLKLHRLYPREVDAHE